MVNYLILAGVLILQFAHMPFSGDMEWYVGWTSNDIAVILLCAGWFISVPYNKPVIKSLLILLASWVLFTAFMNLVNWGGGSSWALFILYFTFILSWLSKQILAYRLPKESDPYTEDRYMFWVKPIKDFKGLGNYLNPFNFTHAGGRMVTGGGNSWRVKGDRFARQKFNSPGKHEGLIRIDTGIPVSPEINAQLDQWIGEKFKPWSRDCSVLEPGISLAAAIRNKNNRK